MKNALLALLALNALTVPSLAADMPVKAPLQRLVVADLGWAGMYAGINGGWNLGSFSPFCRICGPVGTEINLDDNNPFVGGHIGYLYQNGNFVLGPEIGIQYWAFKSKNDKDIIVGPETVITATFQQKIDWLAYANARAGFTVTPGVLVYLTGGAAWAHVKGNATGLTPINLLTPDMTNEQSVFGINIGGGVEFKISEYLIFGGEYRHYDFGKVSAANPVLNLMGIGSSDRLTTDQAMARLTYRLVP